MGKINKSLVNLGAGAIDALDKVRKDAEFCRVLMDMYYSSLQA
jgi:hypothetical protein